MAVCVRVDVPAAVNLPDGHRRPDTGAVELAHVPVKPEGQFQAADKLGITAVSGVGLGCPPSALACVLQLSVAHVQFPESLPLRGVVKPERPSSMSPRLEDVEREYPRVVEHHIEVIRSEWNEVCDQAQLPSAEREQLWERQFLNPFSISTRGFGATAGA